jgi:hypothetical protein
MRKYGWIAITAVVLIVGGASYSEWQKARTAAAAQSLGDSILAALSNEDAAVRTAALEKIEVTGRAKGLVDFMLSANALSAEDRPAAIARLQEVTADASLPALYRDLAVLKSVLLQGAETPADDRIAMLQPLTTAGAPFRLLAEEQIALVLVEKGDTSAALTKLQAILLDTEVTAGLRRRASQLIVALGGDLSAA